MSEKPKYAFAAEHLQIGRIDADSGAVYLTSIDTREIKIAPPPETEGQVAFSFPVPITASLEMKMTTEQAAFFFDTFFKEPQLIAKIPTKKGDFYAPVKSHTGGEIVLDIPDDEAAAWEQSDYWKAQLEQREGGE